MEQIIARDKATGTKLFKVRDKVFAVQKGSTRKVFGNINKATDIFLFASNKFNIKAKNRLNKQLKKKYGF